MNIRGIKYIAPVLGDSGYSKAARGNILALHSLEVPLTLSPIKFEGMSLPDLGKEGRIISSLIGKNIDYNIVISHVTPEHWERFLEKDKTMIGYTIWETEGLYPTWPKWMNLYDKILVGCNWNKEVFKLEGVTKPIGVVPHGIDMGIFEGIQPYNIKGVGRNTYVFYNIAQWTERKNISGLLKAYWAAFTKGEDVALVIKTNVMGYTDREKNWIRDQIRDIKNNLALDRYAPVYLILELLSEDEILGLHSRGDCYVSLDRGEGFGLSPFTAGACGNPIIITGFGGAKEYAKENNSYLVDYTKTPVFNMLWSPWYRGDQWWAEPSLEHAVGYMKRVYREQELAKDQGRVLKDYIAEHFTWEVIGKRIIHELEVI